MRKDFTRPSITFVVMEPEVEEVSLFQSSNKGGFLLDVVAELRSWGNIRYFLRTYHEEDTPDTWARYDPSLTDFRELGLLLLGLSELARTNLYATESTITAWKQLLKPLAETLAVQALQGEDLEERRKTLAELKKRLGINEA